MFYILTCGEVDLGVMFVCHDSKHDFVLFVKYFSKFIKEFDTSNELTISTMQICVNGDSRLRQDIFFL